MRYARQSIFGAAAFLAAIATATAALAVNSEVRSACRDDYLRHCSGHAVGSVGLKQCMRAVGENLSTPCLVALVKAGEVTKEDIERHNAKQASSETETAQVPKKKDGSKVQAEPVKTAQKTTAKLKTKASPTAAAEKQAGKSKTKVAVAQQGGNLPGKPQKQNVPAKKLTAVAAVPSYGGPVQKPKLPADFSEYEADEVVVLEPVPQNVCQARRFNGSTVEFTCGVDQRCCYRPVFDQEYCRPLGKPCF